MRPGLNEVNTGLTNVTNMYKCRCNISLFCHSVKTSAHVSTEASYSSHWQMMQKGTVHYWLSSLLLREALCSTANPVRGDTPGQHKVSKLHNIRVDVPYLAPFEKQETVHDVPDTHCLQVLSPINGHTQGLPRALEARLHTDPLQLTSWSSLREKKSLRLTLFFPVGTNTPLVSRMAQASAPSWS